MIIIENLKQQNAGRCVLNIPELYIPTGQKLGVTGCAGAGKTMLFTLLMDLVPAFEGKVINHSVVVGESDAWKNHTSAFMDDRFLIGHLKPMDYFLFLGEIRGWNKFKVKEFLFKHPDFISREVLTEEKTLGELSPINQKKAGLIGVFIGYPKVVILDEPFTGLNAAAETALKRILKQVFRDRGITLFISGQHPLQMTDITERLIVLDQGRLVKDHLKPGQTTRDDRSSINAFSA